MKTPVDIDQLIRFLDNKYGLQIIGLESGPRGEESCSYIAAMKDRREGEYFVRLQTSHWYPQTISSFTNSLTASRILRQKARLSQIVAPIATRTGSAVSRFSGHTIVVFPVVKGVTLYKTKVSGNDIAQAARLLAWIHKTDTRIGFPKLWIEQFNDPFRGSLLRLLKHAEGSTLSNSKDLFRRRTRRLLDTHRETILDAMDEMARLKVDNRRISPKLVLTHGDANLANFIKDELGRLHLTDWGDAGRGPVERDLFHFSGRNLESFLRHYARIRSDVELSVSTFAFYYYRWALQEISDFSTRLLYLNTSPREKRHALKELKAYLPVPNRSISRSLARIESILKRALPI